MPVKRGSDKLGSYYRWGLHGKKYYYKVGNNRSRLLAKARSVLQGRAAHSAGYR